MTDKTAAQILDMPLADALGERYLTYALSTIMGRSLPDVRDGLKPVHRRLLFAMRQLRLDPGSGFKKSARVVGDVIGKFHPHGDAAVYDALVRLAQQFAVRYPLIDGQGNFGNVDGDNAAAMRYTEARLTSVAQALLDGIDEDTVDFRPTYDGEGEEPLVLPARFPNLLANGATGIAVGMATSIPPHNAGEICAALLHLIKTPRATIDKLVDLMPGPDFPTGGVLTEDRETIVQAYSTGRGSFRVRARYEVEPLKHGQYQIVVTEIPYQVQKAPTGGTNRRAASRQEIGGIAGRARRIGRRYPSRSGAPEPERGAGNPDGVPLPADRSGKPNFPEYERTGQWQHPASYELARGSAGLSGP